MCHWYDDAGSYEFLIPTTLKSLIKIGFITLAAGQGGEWSWLLKHSTGKHVLLSYFRFRLLFWQSCHVFTCGILWVVYRGAVNTQAVQVIVMRVQVRMKSQLISLIIKKWGNCECTFQVDQSVTVPSDYLETFSHS